jgi:purine-nucleoside phosphorylase
MNHFNEACDYLRSVGVDNPHTGVVLGTGLHKLLEHVEDQHVIPYSSIPHFPVSTVEFHKGNLVFGRIADKKVLLMQGRFHVYEGYSQQQLVLPVRVMKMLGVENLLLTNAAGGISAGLKKGDLVLVTDHINLQSGNPLTGQNFEELGPRFPDMSQPYSTRLEKILSGKATGLGIELKQGVYAAVNGPNLETRAEYRFLGIIGADMVGMSTVPEVIACNHMQLPCAAISVITDECDPANLQPVNIEEIIATAAQADGKLAELLRETIVSL